VNAVCGFSLLANTGLGRRTVQLAPRQVFFTQADLADSVFYVRSGHAKITIVSQAGKEATIALLSAGDFTGERALTAERGLRSTTVTAITACGVLKVRREEMIRIMHEEHDLSDLFLSSSPREVCASRLTLSISYAIPARSGWPGFFC
jgi:CRP/FNR family cyclic AMP-dependent transcriptional regulator